MAATSARPAEEQGLGFKITYCQPDFRLSSVKCRQVLCDITPCTTLTIVTSHPPADSRLPHHSQTSFQCPQDTEAKNPCFIQTANDTAWDDPSIEPGCWRLQYRGPGTWQAGWRAAACCPAAPGVPQRLRTATPAICIPLEHKHILPRLQFEAVLSTNPSFVLLFLSQTL